jgi:glutamate racemase
MKIGILDSGVGGTSIMQGLETVLPEHTYIYYADSDNFPYSTKTKETLITIAVNNVELLLLQGAELIVIACNTLTVAALEHLRKTFPNIQFIGTVPAVKKAADSLPIDSTVVVLATAHTAQSTYLAALIEKYSKGQEFIVIGTTDLVTAVEENDMEHARYLLSILLEKLSKDKKISGVVIGCTHFSFIEKEIREVIGYQIKIFDSIEGITKQVRLTTSS